MLEIGGILLISVGILTMARGVFTGKESRALLPFAPAGGRGDCRIFHHRWAGRARGGQCFGLCRLVVFAGRYYFYRRRVVVEWARHRVRLARRLGQRFDGGRPVGRGVLDSGLGNDYRADCVGVGVARDFGGLRVADWRFYFERTAEW